jgi:T5SS/PEP-CTERM-associated repeat protein
MARHSPKQFWILIPILAALAAAVGQTHAQTFNVGANFTTQTRADGVFEEPPDTMGAAGPNQFVAFNNNGFCIFNKDGSLVSRVSETDFWTSALGANPGNLSDPRILYDPASQRWFATMITTDQATNNKILLARSNTADPTQGFKGVSYTTTNGLFADFPTLGLDANGVYVGTNDFTASSSFSNVGIYSVPKADLLADTPTLIRLTNLGTLSVSTYGDSLQAAVNYGPKLATDPETIVAVSSSSGSRNIFTRLSGTTGSGATLGTATSKSVQSTSTPTASSQPGSSNTIDNGERNFSGNVVQVGTFLYSVRGTRVSGRTAARWTIADASTLAIVQQGTISSPSLSYFYPSIAVNASGDVVVGFSGSNSTTFASTYAVVGTSAGGVPGGSLTFGAPVQTKAGIDFYDGTRWGDYSATTLDPADPGIFWTHQEYAGARTISGTNWNWATQATEIVPTKPGELRWSTTAGGSFGAATNSFTGTPPAPTNHVIFSRPNASYTVAFSGTNGSDRASIRQGDVTWDLSGGSYTLSNASPATPSLAVAEFQGTAALTVSGGALNSIHAMIGGAAGGSGAVNVNAGGNWTNSGNLIVGNQGSGVLTIADQGLVYVGSDLSIGVFGTVNLNGGALRFDGYIRSGTLHYTSGTVQLAGIRTIGSDAAVQDFFGAAPEIGAGKGLVVEGDATLAASASVTLSGGTLTAQTVSLSPGSSITSTQPAQVRGAILAQAGSEISAGGDLLLGDTNNVNGFYGSGTVHVGQSKVTLADANDAVFDASAQVTLGSGGNPGILSAANGLTLNAGGVISGHGTIDTPNDAAKPLVNSGSFTGNSSAEPLALPGYVQGAGTFENVDFTGTFSPGFGPAQLSMGRAVYDGTLDIELAGLTPGSEYDQLNHSLGDGLASLGGTLDVSLLAGFTPQAGDVFEIMTAIGGIDGTFASTILPALAGNLTWNVDYGANSVTLAVAAVVVSVPGDYNGDGIVDAADYTVWRDTLGQVGIGLPADGDGNGVIDGGDYDVWTTNFGNHAGAGASGSASAAVPEPSTLVMLLTGILSIFCRRRPNVP